jgi:hypothetical protein
MPTRAETEVEAEGIVVGVEDTVVGERVGQAEEVVAVEVAAAAKKARFVEVVGVSAPRDATMALEVAVVAKEEKGAGGRCL